MIKVGNKQNRERGGGDGKNKFRIMSKVKRTLSRLFQRPRRSVGTKSMSVLSSSGKVESVSAVANRKGTTITFA